MSTHALHTRMLQLRLTATSIGHFALIPKRCIFTFKRLTVFSYSQVYSFKCTPAMLSAVIVGNETFCSFYRSREEHRQNNRYKLRVKNIYKSVSNTANFTAWQTGMHCALQYHICRMPCNSLGNCLLCFCHCRDDLFYIADMIFKISRFGVMQQV